MSTARRMSMATRIAILAACAVGLAVAIASLAAYVSLRDQLHGRLDNQLLVRANAADATSVENIVVDGPYTPAVLGAADLRMYLVSVNGGVLPARGSSLVRPVPRHDRLVAAGELSYNLRTVVWHGHAFRLVTVPSEQPGTALVMAQSEDSIRRTLDRMGLVLLLVGGGGILAAGVISLAVARSALVPVRRLSAAAERIARTDVLAPIEVTGDDELASLTLSFNRMVEALEGSRERQRQLVADAGHELRTPLTSLRTNLELLAQADRHGGLAPEQRDEIFVDVTAQVEELSTLVGDLVELARDEPLARDPEPVDLLDVVQRAAERGRRRAPRIRLSVVTSSWWVLGEAPILERAVLNLIDNATKFAVSEVTVTLADGVVTVTDDGPGVSEVDRPKLFERFYRSAESRDMPGSGLGLSIVKQAAERHGGWVTVDRAPGKGAQFAMYVPGAEFQAGLTKPRADA